MRIFAISTLFLLLMLSACTSVKQADNVVPDAKKGGILGMAKVKGIQVTGGKAVRGETRVVVPYFRVAFYTNENPGGFSNGSGDKVMIRSKLLGVDSAVLQRITDQAYRHFVAQMKEKGFDVQPFSVLESSKTYNAFKNGGTQYKKKALFGPKAIYVSPTGLRMSRSGFSRQSEVGKIIKETQASVMDVTLYVTYLTQSLKKKLAIVTGIRVGQTSMVIPGSNVAFYGYKASKCKGFCPDTVATVKLGQPVYRTDKVGILKDSTTAGDTAGDVAMTALSWVSSGTKLHRTKRYELHADPVKYEKVVTAVLDDATRKMVNSLSANR